MGILEEHAAIVTGGGTGIGLGVAQKLGQAGAHVMICGRREEQLREAEAVIRGAGGIVNAVVADVATEEGAAAVVEAAYNAYGAVDILVNNAAVSGGGRIAEHDVATWDRVIAANLRGPFLMARAVLPIMHKQKRGYVVNISSESGIEHYPGNGAYGVSKHALNALSEFIQRENQELGVRVATICPGMVATPMTDGYDGLDRRKCLFPEDIADLVLYLVTRRRNVKIGTPILMQTMVNPWRSSDEE